MSAKRIVAGAGVGERLAHPHRPVDEFGLWAQHRDVDSIARQLAQTQRRLQRRDPAAGDQHSKVMWIQFGHGRHPTVRVCPCQPRESALSLRRTTYASTYRSSVHRAPPPAQPRPRVPDGRSAASGERRPVSRPARPSCSLTLYNRVSGVAPTSGIAVALGARARSTGAGARHSTNTTGAALPNDRANDSRSSRWRNVASTIAPPFASTA